MNRRIDMEWKEVRLGEVCSKIGSGATPSGGKEAYKGGNYHLVRSQNVLDFGFSWEGLASINDEQAKKLQNVELQENDVLLNITGDSVARSCMIPNEVLPARVNQHVAIIRADKRYLDCHYLLYYMQQQKPLLLQLASGGATRKAITKGMLEDLKILLPSLSQQQKIANILSSLDAKIENNNKINANLEAQAAALFKSWFVDFEPFKDGEFVESELGMIPKGWKVDLLGSLIKTTSGGTPSRKNEEFYSNADFCWVKSKELCGGFVLDTEEKITENAIAKSSAKLLPEYSTLIAMYGATVGEYGIITKQMTCNQAICALLPNDNFPFTFLFMLAKNMKEQLLNMAVGSAQQNISQVIIKNIPISYDLNTIIKFHSIIQPLMVKIKNNTDENQRLSSLRDTLLHKLMSGEIDLENISI